MTQDASLSWLDDHFVADRPVLVNADTGTLANIASLTPAPVARAGAIRFTGAAPTLTGITNGVMFGRPRRLVLMAVGGPLVVADESAASSSENRIVTGTGANVTVAQGGAVSVAYDDASLRWRIEGGAPAGGAGTPDREVVTFADADITLSATQAEKAVIKIAGSNATRACDLIFPAVTGARVYVVENWLTGANGVRLRMPTGTSWVLPPASGGGATHVALLTPDGVTLLGPAGVPATMGVQYINASGYFSAIPIGAAGQVLKVNATANGYEWGAGGGGSGTTPTGTGFRHVTAGVEDAAAKLVADADVDATAAIAGTKIAADFGAQNIVTTGAVQAGTTPRAATGVVQLPNGTGLIKTRNAGNTADLVAFEIGPDNQWRAGNGGEPAGYVFHGGGNFGWYRGGAYGFYTDTSSFQFGTPRLGLSTPYASDGQAVVSLAGANYTLAAAEYSRAFIAFAGTSAAGLVVTFPAVADLDHAYAKDMNNTCPDALTLSNGGGTTATIAGGAQGRYWFNTSGVFGPL